MDGPRNFPEGFPPTNSARRKGPRRDIQFQQRGFDVQIGFTSPEARQDPELPPFVSPSPVRKPRAVRTCHSHRGQSRHHISLVTTVTVAPSCSRNPAELSMATYPPPNSDQWRTGFCGCFEDFESCESQHTLEDPHKSWMQACKSREVQPGSLARASAETVSKWY